MAYACIILYPIWRKFMKNLNIKHRKHSAQKCFGLYALTAFFIAGILLTACDMWGFYDDGIHYITGTEYDLYGYDKDGYNAAGFNADGNHRNGTKYNDDGYDKTGYNAEGFNAAGKHRDTGTEYNLYGYDKDGYNAAGYDIDGYNADGYDAEGYNKDGYNANGYNRNGYKADGYNAAGFNADGNHRNGKKYNDDGYDEQGYDKDGFNAEGYDINGYDINGFNADGNHRVTGGQYDLYGYNAHGYNSQDNHRDDFLVLAAANEKITDIFSDGTTMWVLDYDDKHIYAYNMITKEQDTTKEFSTNTLTTAGNNYPTGIWSDGTTMWVADVVSRKIYAYNITSKARDESKEFVTSNGGSNVRGIWSNGTTMWVADTDETIYAYDYAINTEGNIDMTYKASKNFSATETDSPFSIWSNGATMWITDEKDKKIYAYDYSINAAGAITVTYDDSKDFAASILSTAGITTPAGIWSDGTTMWVGGSGKILAYDLATGARPPTAAE